MVSLFHCTSTATISLYFQSICEFVKKQHTQRVIEGTEDSPEPGPSGLITNDMIDKVFKIRLEDPQFAKVTGSHAYVTKEFVPSKNDK